MARPFPQPPVVIRRIMRLAKQGKSCRHIAGIVGLSRTTVSNIARKEGHVWGAVNTKKAAEANRAYGAEWRAEFIKRLSAKCADLLGDMDGAYLVFNFGGKDNDYNEHTLDSPPTEAKERLMKSIRLGMQTVLDVDRRDNVAGGLTDVQEYLLRQKGERPSC